MATVLLRGRDRVPHETQEGCIEALHAEIARMRDVLSRSDRRSGPPDDLSLDDADPGRRRP